MTEFVDPLATHIAAFKHRRVLVLGDAILDEYLIGDSSRISPEAPVPVLTVSSCRRVLGGAANTAANIRSLGGHATLISLVGHDEGGATLRRCALDAGIDLQPVDGGVPTLRKTRVVARQQQIVRLDYEDTEIRHRSFEANVLRLFEGQLNECDIVVISDYGKGFLSPVLSQRIIQRAHETDRQVIVDPRPQNRDCYVDCDYLTPNWRESRGLLRLPDVDPTEDQVFAVSTVLASELRTNVVLTLGPHGISFCSRDCSERFSLPTLAREVFDVSGAGDTVVAAFALARASGADHATAVTLANRAASVVVGKFGTATVSADEILQDSNATRLVSRHRLSHLAANLRAEGKRIVTINGSFDILHSGHLHILTEARERGDVLIVGLNSDASIRSYKGANRPLVSQQRRAEMLLALRIVDYVHIFDELDPVAFIEAIKPDIHVNGAEYGENCIESETVRRGGGRLHLVRRIGDLSTSGLAAALQSTGAATSS